jgi:hypothetical protein
MNFKTAISELEARTENNMKARATSANAGVDLFYSIGASRGKDIIPAFVASLDENEDYALRISQWGRDVRGGAGERQIFRDILTYLTKTAPNTAIKLIRKTPVVGRWDDVWAVFGLNDTVDSFILDLISENIGTDGLLAKWLPRKKKVINGKDFTGAIRTKFSLTPKQYRKILVKNTSVVETQMCANDFDSINFSHVPSVAHNRYRKAFIKRASESYIKYLTRVKEGTAKVNAEAIFPHDVLRVCGQMKSRSPQERESVLAQWAALPNYLTEDSSILPLVDVSGSMTASINGTGNITCLDVAVALGLYVADKNTGAFSDCVLTFSYAPQLLNLKGDVLQKGEQLIEAHWEMNTNLHAAFDVILKTAVDNSVSQSDMPKTLLILSDMQFDRCVRFDDSAAESVRRKYENAGYAVPNVVFWNLDDRANVPVRFDELGTALVSGFSPSILRSILAGESMSPESLMLDAILKPRYDV